MANTFIRTDYFRTKFYQKENSSKKFLELSEEQLSTLSKRVYKEKETLAQKSKNIS